VSKQATEKFDVQRFNDKKLSDLHVRKQYQIKISKGFAALGNFNDGEDIKRAWENIKENIKTPAKEILWVYEVSSIIHSLLSNIYEF